VKYITKLPVCFPAWYFRTRGNISTVSSQKYILYTSGAKPGSRLPSVRQ